MNKTQGVSISQIESRADGQRLDNFLIYKLKGVPKSHIYRIIRKGEVRVNKKRVKASSRLHSGDTLRLPPLSSETVEAKEVLPSQIASIKSCIEHQDNTLLLLNKPAGLAVHGGSGVSLGVIERMRALYPDEDFELVHRLDKDTSGCLLIAKKRSFLKQIHKLLREKSVKKTYLTLLSGRWRGPRQKIVDAPLLKYSGRGGERFVKIAEEGKPSSTMFQVVENFKDSCLVEARPVTGRTHQIRVHAASLGQPIVGDSKYGNKALLETMKELSCERLYLHALSIQFQLEQPTCFTIKPDADWLNVIKHLRNESIQ